MIGLGISELAKSARLRVPQDHGTILERPPRSGALGIIESNQRLLSRCPQELQAIRLRARQELAALALRYSNRYLESPLSLPVDAQAIVMSGHQPALFHPGVWFKNFVLDAVATRSDAISINLVVDNDLCDNLRVCTPQMVAGSQETALHVPIDQAGAVIPFEARKIINVDQFSGFGQRLAEAVSPSIEAPLIESLWPEVVAVSGDLSLPASLAAGRHRLEVRNGIRNLELPVGLLCSSEAFAKFLARIIREAVRLREIYNGALEEHRIANRIRSRSHPVPALEQTGEYCELPFWFWSAENPQRRRLFVKSSQREVELSDRAGWSVKLSQRDLAAGLLELNRLGSKECIRPRALMTTMFSRLFVSDLFIHGIGGSKYDELGDQITRRFFGVSPPQWMTVSATMKLPGEGFDWPKVSRESIGDLELRLREMRFHPEREFPDDDRAKKKRALVANPPVVHRKVWHQAIETINSELYAELEAETKAIEQALTEAREALPMAELLNSREFSFALFPSSLIDELKRLAE